MRDRAIRHGCFLALAALAIVSFGLNGGRPAAPASVLHAFGSATRTVGSEAVHRDAIVDGVERSTLRTDPATRWIGLAVVAFVTALLAGLRRRRRLHLAASSGPALRRRWAAVASRAPPATA